MTADKAAAARRDDALAELEAVGDALAAAKAAAGARRDELAAAMRAAKDAGATGDQVAAASGISRQAFYAELRKNGSG